jgi:hypothetical protein
VVGKDDVQLVKDVGYKVTIVKEINSKIVKVYYLNLDFKVQINYILRVGRKKQQTKGVKDENDDVC